MTLGTDRQDGYVRLKAITDERRLLTEAMAKTPTHEGSAAAAKMKDEKDKKEHTPKEHKQHTPKGQGSLTCGTMVTCGSKVYANQTSDSWFTDNAGRAAELRTLQRMMIFMALLFLVCVGMMLWEKRKKRKEAELKAQNLAAAAENPALEDGSNTSCAVDPAAELEGMDRVRMELSKVRLEQYVDAFEEAGYDHWPEIQRLPQARFFKLRQATKMSKNHADRLEELLTNQRQQLGVRRVKTRSDDGRALEDEQCAIL